MNSIVYIVTGILLVISFFTDRTKTVKALKKAAKSLENILPQLLVMLLTVSLLLALMNEELILRLIGGKSGWTGVILSALVGAITLIPGFVAFPMAALLLQGGAGYMQIAAFVSALMMVGIVTLPVEIAYFGKRLAIYRNVLAFAFSFLVAYLIGYVEAFV